MTEVVKSTLEMIQFCLDAYKNFHFMKESCLFFSVILLAVADVLNGIEKELSRFTQGYTSLYAPMKQLNNAIHSGKFIQERCSEKS